MNKQINTQKDVIKSYAQLLQEISRLETKNSEALLELISTVGFSEDTEVLFNSLPVRVLYKQIPAVVAGNLLVKVVVLEQGGNVALIVPEQVAQVYEDTEKNPKVLTEKNISLALYAEVYGFDTSNKKLQDLLKNTYLSAGNAMQAFDLVGIDVVEEPEAASGGDFGGMPMLNNIEAPEPAPVSDFDLPANTPDISVDTNSFDEIKENLDVYKKFKRQNKSLVNLVVSLKENATKILSKNIKFKLLNESKNLLLIEVNNKNIYESFPKAKSVAKQTITKLGEAIRKNKDTQLVDSFIKNGKRYFVVAENIANNFWVVNNENLNKISDKEKTYIVPIQKEVLTLKRSSVRKESRSNIPYKEGNVVVFVKAVK